MPQTRVKLNENLGIELEGRRVSFLPGGTITGCVFRQSTIVSTKATISIVLHGRTKSLFIVNTGQSSAVYRGRFTLINVSQEIFSGPLHIPKDSDRRQEWKFTVDIPETIDASLLPKKYRPKESYLNPATVGMLTLPASFVSIKRTDQAFVEYYLEAKIRVQKERFFVEETAKMPIRILAHHPPADLTSTYSLRIPKSVTSQRLVPGMENAVLTAGQKLKKLVGRSSVPELALHLELGIPNQINSDQRPLPITMRVVPYWPATHEILRNQQQRVRLVSFKATLESRCEILCEGFSWAANKTHWREKLDLLSTNLSSPDNVIEIPCSADEPAMNIGQALDLRIESDGKNSAAFQDFTTFNITFKHRLLWAVKLELAQESISADGAQDIIVLPPTNDPSTPEYLDLEILPEYEADLSMEPFDQKGEPPSFEDVQNECKENNGAGEKKEKAKVSDKQK